MCDDFFETDVSCYVVVAVWEHFRQLKCNPLNRFIHSFTQVPIYLFIKYNFDMSLNYP